MANQIGGEFSGNFLTDFVAHQIDVLQKNPQLGDPASRAVQLGSILAILFAVITSPITFIPSVIHSIYLLSAMSQSDKSDAVSVIAKKTNDIASENPALSNSMPNLEPVSLDEIDTFNKPIDPAAKEHQQEIAATEAPQEPVELLQKSNITMLTLSEKIKKLGIPIAEKEKIKTLSKTSVRTEIQTFGFAVEEKSYSYGKEVGRGASKVAQVVNNYANKAMLVHLRVSKAPSQADPKRAKTAKEARKKRIESLQREVHMQASFRNVKGIVQTQYVYISKGKIKGFGVEYYDQGDLLEFMKKGSLTDAQKWDLFETLATVLIEFQEKTTIHHDIKLANILLREENGKLSFGVTDFGYAMDFKEDALNFTIPGSLLYIAPEKLKKDLSNTNSDLWSVGIILYQLTFGHTPSFLSNHNSLSLQYYLTNSPMEKIEESLRLDENLKDAPPNSLQKLIKDILTADPQQRITPQQFQARLKELRAKPDISFNIETKVLKENQGPNA